MKKMSFLLSGGATYGACEAGALEQISKIASDNNVNLEKMISKVYGSSIGALNACGFIQYLRVKESNPNWMSDIYRDFDISKMLKCEGLNYSLSPLDKENILYFLRGLVLSGKFPLDDLKKYIDSFLDSTIIDSSPVDVGLVLAKGPMVYDVYNKKTINGDYANVIASSCALPIVFKRGKINGNKYVDGGVANGIPVNKATKGDVFVIDLPAPKNVRIFERVVKSGRFNITLIKSGGFVSYESNNSSREMIIYRPTLKGGMLNPAAIEENLEIGKRDIENARPTIEAKVLKII